jgi:hypothetical protein
MNAHPENEAVPRRAISIEAAKKGFLRKQAIGPSSRKAC